MFYYDRPRFPHSFLCPLFRTWRLLWLGLGTCGDFEPGRTTAWIELTRTWRLEFIKERKRALNQENDQEKKRLKIQNFTFDVFSFFFYFLVFFYKFPPLAKIACDHLVEKYKELAILSLVILQFLCEQKKIYHCRSLIALILRRTVDGRTYGKSYK